MLTDVHSTLVYTRQDTPPSGPGEAPEEDRRRNLMYTDPVHKINMGQYVHHVLLGAISASGGPAEFQDHWLINVDQEVQKAFQELEIM